MDYKFFIVLVISLRYICSEKKITIEKKKRGDILGIVRSDMYSSLINYIYTQWRHGFSIHFPVILFGLCDSSYLLCWKLPLIILHNMI